jgi:hypothetical protein
MKPWEIHCGDVRKVLKSFPSNHFDAAFGDPPYAYKFMGHRWDYTLPSVLTWTEMLRVLKPGAHAAFFGGPRTFHRLVCAIEDAGFLPDDLLMYLHGKGFPKSHNISKSIDASEGAKRAVIGSRTLTGNAAYKEGGHGFAEMAQGKRTIGTKEIPITVPSTQLAQDWDGWGTALKPAYEPIALVMKNTEGTYAENAKKWGVGGLNLPETRIGNGGTRKGTFPKEPSKNCYGDGINGACEIVQTGDGRWPANLMLDEEAAAALDEQTGDHPSTPYRENVAAGAVLPLTKRTAGGYSDSGGVSRFFYTTKVGKFEREAGCTDVENDHPTLKSLDLARWIATLLLPPKRDTPRRILVPYSGSGSEMIGCLQAGWESVIGIEGEAHNIEIAKARITQGGVFSALLDKRMRK